MRKIRHGFIALAVLRGPAPLILAHQKLTETLPQDASHLSDVPGIVQQAYSRCSAAPRHGLPDPPNARTTAGLLTSAQPARTDATRTLFTRSCSS
jgi:hypothetical protein